MNKREKIDGKNTIKKKNSNSYIKKRFLVKTSSNAHHGLLVNDNLTEKYLILSKRKPPNRTLNIISKDILFHFYYIHQDGNFFITTNDYQVATVGLFIISIKSRR